jgi:hypothetical protein
MNDHWHHRFMHQSPIPIRSSFFVSLFQSVRYFNTRVMSMAKFGIRSGAGIVVVSDM